MCSIGRDRGRINCKRTLSLRKVLFVSQSKDQGHVELLSHAGGQVRCLYEKYCQLCSLIMLMQSSATTQLNYWALSLSFPVLPSVHSVFFPSYTSFPELHPNCSDSVGLIQLLQCCSMHCEDRTQGQPCYFHSNFANACQMTEVPYLFIFKPLWQGFLGLSINNYFARYQ